jgi:hypothetical protein
MCQAGVIAALLCIGKRCQHVVSAASASGFCGGAACWLMCMCAYACASHQCCACMQHTLWCPSPDDPRSDMQQLLARALPESVPLSLGMEFDQ